MTRQDHRDADLYDSQFFDEKDWERATDEAAKLLLSDEAEFEKHVLAETGLDMETDMAMVTLRHKLAGTPYGDEYPLITKILLTAYNAAVDRLARKQLEAM